MLPSLNKVTLPLPFKALAQHRDEQLTEKANGIIRAFRELKAYVDGVTQSGQELSEAEIIVVSYRVPMTLEFEFMGELSGRIEALLKKNTVSDADKCLKYCELYAQLAALKDMMLTQIIGISDPMSNDRNGVLAYQIAFRRGIKHLFESLYTVNYGQKITPFFDPDSSVITDAFSTTLLNLGNYDRSVFGLYCIENLRESKDLVWSTLLSDSYFSRKPYLVLTTTAIGKWCPMGEILSALSTTRIVISKMPSAGSCCLGKQCMIFHAGQPLLPSAIQSPYCGK